MENLPTNRVEVRQHDLVRTATHIHRDTIIYKGGFDALKIVSRYFHLFAINIRTLVSIQFIFTIIIYHLTSIASSTKSNNIVVNSRFVELLFISYFSSSSFIHQIRFLLLILFVFVIGTSSYRSTLQIDNQ